MVSQQQRDQLCEIIAGIGRQEKKMEAVRQLLCEYSQFAPYTVFTRLDTRQVNSLSPYDFKYFSISNNSILTLSVCQLFMELHDNDRDSELSFHEFLDAVLPQDNPQLRYETLQRESRPLLPDERINDEVEYTLVKLIDWEVQGEQAIEQQKYQFLSTLKHGQTPISFLTDCFYAINTSQNGLLTESDLQVFFRNNQQQIFPDEINGFFRRTQHISNNSSNNLTLEDFIHITDIAAYRHSKINQKTQKAQPIKQESYTPPTNHNLNTFGAQPANRSRIYSQDQSPLPEIPFTPQKYNKGGMAFDIPTQASRSTSEKKRTTSNSFMNSTKKQQNISRNQGSGDLEYQEGREGFNKQIQQKHIQPTPPKQQSSILRDSSHSKQLNQSKRESAQKQPLSGRQSKSRTSLSSDKKSNQKQSSSKTPISPFKVIAGNNDSAQKQTLLQFKQDIRGQLATNKVEHERSGSPKKVAFQSKELNWKRSTSSDKTRINKKQLQLLSNKKEKQNLDFSIESKDRSNREDSSSKLSRSYLTLDKTETPQKNINKSQAQGSQQKTISSHEKYVKTLPDDSIVIYSEKKRNTNSYKKSPLKKQTHSIRSQVSQQIHEYFNAVISSSQKLERAKQLTIRMSDFNLFDAFKLMDKSQSGILTAFNIQSFLANQNIAVSMKEITYFIKRFDTLKQGTICFSDLREAIMPIEEEHQRIIDSRAGSGIIPVAEAFCRETMKLFTRLIIEHISVEYQLEVIRQSISQDKSWNYEQAFDFINQSANGFISLVEVQKFLLTEGSAANRQDASYVLTRFDKDKDGVISIIDFATELYPISFM